MGPSVPPSPQTVLASALQTVERLENQLRQARQLATAGLLAEGIAHDFNNLLTIINGYNDLLLRSFRLPEDVRKYVAINRQAGGRAARLVRGLLASSGKMRLEPVALDLNASVRELASLANSFLPAHVEFSTELAADLETVRADPGGIQQILLNLLVNARDAMPEGGKLEIRTANLALGAEGNYVLLTFSDTGSGMDEETKQRLFEPFYTTKGDGSTGLGLHMVQQIVRESGGLVSVTSGKDTGTTVRIYLPAAAERPIEEAPPQSPRGGTEAILVVEDNCDLRHLLCTMLENLGYGVLEAESAAEAVELSRGLVGDIDLLVADAVLPDSTGSALARQLREDRPELPVLHISGYAEESRSEAPGPEADFLSKPFTMEIFGQKVRSILDRRKQWRVLFVDDDAEVVMFASRVLRDAGFEVLVGANGSIALSTVQSEALDVVITDLVMPEREGLETIMRLRKSHPSLPIIAISGAFGGHFLKGATTLGASAILAKPFSGDELLEAVRTVLGIGV